MKILLTYLGLFFPFLLYSQGSLVFYSGFEENFQPVYVTTDLSDFNSVWFSAASTPDIFSINPANNAHNVPNNFVGTQNALSGQSYGGFLTTYADNNFHVREWFGAKLFDTLVAGQNYCVKFSISLADTVKYASNNIGMYFSSDSIFDSFVFPQDIPYPTDYNYVVTTPSNLIYTDSLNWTKIELHYTANGGERYVYIGNFYPDSLTNYQIADSGPPNYHAAYYYIDEVFVYKCEGVSLTETPTSPITIYPNPAQEFVSVGFPQGVGKAQVSVYTIMGQLVLQQQLTALTQQISIGSLNPALYVFVVQAGDKVWREKVVKE